MSRFVTSARIALLLVFVHMGLVGYGIGIHFPSRNEVAHVPAGISVWNTGTFHLYRVNPPLPRTLATIPVLALAPACDTITPSIAVDARDEWVIARNFADENATRYLTIIRVARLMGICWSVLGAAIVWRWTKELYGSQGALIAVAIWCLGPTINAHAQMVTPDLPATVAGLGSTYIFWRYLRTGTWCLAVVAGIVLGLAQLCKFTLLTLYPVWAVLGVVFFLTSRMSTHPARSKLDHFLKGVTIGLLSVVVLNIGYLCDGTGIPLGEFPFVSRSLAGELPNGRTVGNRFHDSWAANIPVPVPFDYLSGIDLQRIDFETLGQSYLAGERRADGGWWYYYAYALAIKTPIGVLLLSAWSLSRFLCARSRSARWNDELVLWLSFLVLFVFVSSQTGLNRHSRYVLPALPFVVIACGNLGSFFETRQRFASTLIIALGLGFVVSTARVYPHTLSYFNEFIGGPNNGHRHLIDSNIDWGQDLLLAADWLRTHPTDEPKTYIGVSHIIDYRHAGFELALAPLDPMPGDISHPDDIQAGPHPGTFLVDVTSLVEGPYRWLDHFRPTEKIGYSIFVFRVDSQEANAVRLQLGMQELPPSR